MLEPLDAIQHVVRRSLHEALQRFTVPHRRTVADERIVVRGNLAGIRASKTSPTANSSVSSRSLPLIRNQFAISSSYSATAFHGQCRRVDGTLSRLPARSPSRNSMSTRVVCFRFSMPQILTRSDGLKAFSR